MSTEIFNGDLPATLKARKKPFLHRIVLTENKNIVDLRKLSLFYLNCLFFRGESTKIKPRSRFTIEPRFALGDTDFIRTLAPIAAAKIKRHRIRQIIAPGYGGMCALGCFLATGEKFKWACVRIDQVKPRRIITRFDGYVDPAIPVWITDDLVASGNAAIKTIKVLRESGFKVAGLIPVVADLTGNTGCRAFETISMTMRFKFDYLVGVQKREKEAHPAVGFFDTRNKAILD